MAHHAYARGHIRQKWHNMAKHWEIAAAKSTEKVGCGLPDLSRFNPDAVVAEVATVVKTKPILAHCNVIVLPDSSMGEDVKGLNHDKGTMALYLQQTLLVGSLADQNRIN
eukprot:14274645-Ditylum_brightwellii.AAC.1